MYHQYFGLNEAPFSIAVNPRYLFMSDRHRDALAHLLYGVGAGGGFILLTGEVGTGKTTINRCLLEQLPQDTDIAIILNPALNAMELLATVCDELCIGYDHDHHTLKTLTDKLHRYLLDNHARGRRTVLLIDEAQHLGFEVLEQIRLLTNLETNSEKLLQIILIGQPELAEKLARPELRQLNQRITARYNLEPLNLEETGAYIHHRLQVAGMSPERVIFPPRVVRGVYRATRGIPRLVNVLCDRILLGAYGRNKTRADLSTLHLAEKEVLGLPSAHRVRWHWPAAGLALLLVLAAGWWIFEQQGVLPDRAVPGVPMASNPAPTATPEPPPTEEPQAPADSPEPVPDIASAVPLGQTVMQSVLLPPGESMAQLWQLYAGIPSPDVPCSRRVREGVACIEGAAQAWDELLAFNRPLSLTLLTPERFAAEILLLDLQGTHALVWSRSSDVISIPLSQLAPLWDGSFRYLWHPPAGFDEPLSLADEGAAVAEIALMFARLDAQPEPLAGQRFNRELEERVRLFQRRHALLDDGVVGVATLLKLNEALGIDITSDQAAQRLQSSEND
ncbi:MAG: AAA family ATPase [Pseudomonadota bacterium]